MIGRAVLGNPWLLSQTHEYLLHGTLPAEPTVRQIKEILLKHLHLLMEYYGEKAGIAVSRKHVGWYVRSLRPKSFASNIQSLRILKRRKNL